MTYKVVAENPLGCDCEDCRAGRHLYSLFRLQDGKWQYVGTTLQTYATPEACIRDHSWGVQFEPDAVWEDGCPVVQVESTPASGLECGESEPPGMVQINSADFADQMETLLKHLRALHLD